MFGSNDKKKNAEFVGKVQAARQQRAEEKDREKAAICIQVNEVWPFDENKQALILRFISDLFIWSRIKTFRIKLF